MMTSGFWGSPARLLCRHCVPSDFVTVYELFDELMDYGFPQTTEVPVLNLMN